MSAIADLDRLRADLRAARRDVKRLEKERDTERAARERAEADLAEETALREKLAGILTATANALRGEPGPLASHGWSDLPERSRALLAERDRLRDILRRDLAARRSGDVEFPAMAEVEAALGEGE
jgi:uncharacterized protein (DUF3084 family)